MRLQHASLFRTAHSPVTSRLPCYVNADEAAQTTRASTTARLPAPRGPCTLATPERTKAHAPTHAHLTHPRTFKVWSHVPQSRQRRPLVAPSHSRARYQRYCTTSVSCMCFRAVVVPVRPRQIDLTLGRRPFMLAPAATLMQIAAMRLARRRRRRRRKRGSDPLRIAMLVSRLIQIEFSSARCCTRCRALLRDAICMYRGRGWPFPDAAIGPSRGASPLIGRRHFHDFTLAARPPSSQRQRSIERCIPCSRSYLHHDRRAPLLLLLRERGPPSEPNRGAPRRSPQFPELVKSPNAGSRFSVKSPARCFFLVTFLCVQVVLLLPSCPLSCLVRRAWRPGRRDDDGDVWRAAPRWSFVRYCSRYGLYARVTDCVWSWLLSSSSSLLGPSGVRGRDVYSRAD